MPRGKDPGRQSPAWHALPVEDVLRRQATDTRGLAESEAAARLVRVGRNVLPARRPPTAFAILLHQFLSPLIYILLAAAAVALVLGDLVDAGFIMAVVLLNAGLGTFQEWRAEQSAVALQSLLTGRARVRRDGVEHTVPVEDVVPGDIVLVESGNRVPADLRVLRARDLRIDESFLTGESLPATKVTDPVADDVPVGDRRSLAFGGSTVASGRGEGVVVATGLATEVGAIAKTVSETATTKPPLVVRMEAFARQVSLVVMVACLLLAAIGLVRGMTTIDVFFMAVALAVSAIPEGLPVAMTVALSIATSRMARRGVIVRRLTAVEGLGSCTFIASDKTGTLTVNEQTVRRLVLPSGRRFDVSGEAYAGTGTITAVGDGAVGDARAGLDRLITAAVVPNEASLTQVGDQWRHEGDAVDVALLALGYKAGLDPAAVREAASLRGDIPFESERGYTARFAEHEGRVRVMVKGAFEVVLPRCATMLTAEGPVPVDVGPLEAWACDLSSAGHRFLAIADGDLPAGSVDGSHELGEDDLPPLTLLGLVGLIDPPRPEVAEAVRKCQAAGVEVAMVTGDHPLTALVIARAVGIAHEAAQVVTGSDLAALGDSRSGPFREAVSRGRVFARVSPLQKLQIVEALQGLGHFVAVTGDGVNDAPALKMANISVAMGSGSDVTRDTASLIVTDDNFASIEAGVEEGRFAYDNIRKVTYLLISTGAAEVTLFVLALVAGLPLPLLPVQLLWLNLVTNGIQDVALAFEGGEPGAMARPPRRPAEGMFNRLMIQQTATAGLAMGVLAWANFVLLLELGFDVEESRNRLLLLIVLMQNYHVFNCRSERESAFRVPISRNLILVAGVAAAQGIHILAMHVPFMQSVLQIEPVTLREWVVPFVIAGSMIVVMEVFKIVVRARPAPPAASGSR